MGLVRYLPVVIELALLVYCLIDCIQSDEGSVRNLPKTMWVLLIIFLPIVGSVAWLAVGRPQGAPARSVPWPSTRTAGSPSTSVRGRRSERSEPGDGPLHRAARRRAHLHQVAHLLGHPQAASAFLLGAGVHPADQRVGDPAGVRDLDDQAVRLAPHAQEPRTAAMVDAVGGQLVHREAQVVDPVVGDPRLPRTVGNEPADPAEVTLAVAPVLGGRPRSGQALGGQHLGVGGARVSGRDGP